MTSEPKKPPRQEQLPPTQEILEVAPGVLRVQLEISLPGLGHVNCYVIPDGEGVAVIDPGLPGPKPWADLQAGLARAGVPVSRVHTVLVTHNHPDHFGSSGKLAEESGAKLVAHSAFRTFWNQSDADPCDQLFDVDPDDMPDGNPFLAPTPWGAPHDHDRTHQESREKMMQAMADTFVHPTPDVRVRDGDVLHLGGRDWFAVHTPGHTLDHLCLWDPTNGTFLAGDHVLPTITPHISGLGAGRDPLRSYVDSLDKVAAIPGVTTVLPAHGQPFADLPARVESIKVHHVERMEVLRQASLAIGPSSVVELSHHLFRQQVWGTMAESETYAHLEHLRLSGAAARREESGMMIYEVFPISA